MYKLVALALVAASIATQTATTTGTTTTTTTTTARTAAYPNDEYCLAGASSKCTTCAYSYLDANGICQPPTSKLNNCIIYSNATTCTACDEGYNLVNNACQAITIADCLAVTTTTTAATGTTAATTTTTCTVCNNKKLPANGTCANGTACNLSNCDVCASSTRCARCSEKYAVSTDGTCISEAVANCRIGTATACTTCDLGYYNNATSCKDSSVQDSTYIMSAIVALLAFVKLIA